MKIIFDNSNIKKITNVEYDFNKLYLISCTAYMICFVQAMVYIQQSLLLEASNPLTWNLVILQED